MSDLFQFKRIQLHSGAWSDWKIECDALSDEEINLFAHLIACDAAFCRVYSVPTGGDRLAAALQKHCMDEKTMNFPSVLIVDDVLTTGDSIKLRKFDLVNELREEGMEHFVIMGAVLFSRTRSYPRWVRPLFTYGME